MPGTDTRVCASGCQVELIPGYVQNRAAGGTDTRVSVPWHRYGGTDTRVKKLPQGYPKMLRSSYTTKSYPKVSHFGVVLGVHTVTGGPVQADIRCEKDPARQ